MVPIYIQLLPQIILTDFDTECDQVLFSVKQNQNIDDVSIKQSQELSDKICKLEIVLPVVGTNYEENISDEKPSSDVCDDTNKNENKENKRAPTNFGKKASSSRPKVFNIRFSEDKITGKKMARRSSLETSIKPKNNSMSRNSVEKSNQISHVKNTKKQKPRKEMENVKREAVIKTMKSQKV